MIQWHSQINNKAFGVEWSPTDNVERTEMENGKIKTRRINTESKKQFAFNLYLTKSEYYLFEEWWRTSLKDGSLSFEFPCLDGRSGTAEYIPIEQYTASGQNGKEINMRVVEC